MFEITYIPDDINTMTAQLSQIANSLLNKKYPNGWNPAKLTKEFGFFPSQLTVCLNNISYISDGKIKNSYRVMTMIRFFDKLGFDVQVRLDGEYYSPIRDEKIIRDNVSDLIKGRKPETIRPTADACGVTHSVISRLSKQVPTRTGNHDSLGSIFRIFHSLTTDTVIKVSLKSTSDDNSR